MVARVLEMLYEHLLVIIIHEMDCYNKVFAHQSQTGLYTFSLTDIDRSMILCYNIFLGRDSRKSIPPHQRRDREAGPKEEKEL